MKKPLILITPDETVDPVMHRPFYLLKRSYETAVAGAGATPICPLETRYFKEYTEMADGLLISGGIWNIHPGRYNDVYKNKDAKTPDDMKLSFTRDSLELSLCKAFIEAGKPVFGIGRGMEIINVALGGTMYQDLKAELGIDHPIAGSYKVSIAEGSKLAELLGTEITVNNYNNQAVKGLGSGLKCVAKSEDGIIEAIEHESLPIFGVLWHPETYKTDDEINYLAHKDLVDPPEPTPELLAKMAVFMESVKTKSPVPGMPTDSQLERPDDNPLFNYFVQLCRKGA